VYENGEGEDEVGPMGSPGSKTVDETNFGSYNLASAATSSRVRLYGELGKTSPKNTKEGRTVEATHAPTVAGWRPDFGV
jgi:hypothetical protein